MGGPVVFHASAFWKKLCQKNTQWLLEDGVENFKRTVNNNYFNWLVSPRSDYFHRMLKSYLRRHKRSPRKLLALTTPRIAGGLRRTYVSSNERFGYWEKKLYAIYLLCLHDYVSSVDRLEDFARMEEPPVGNPIIIENAGRRISQDLCNSYLEYLFMLDSLGGRFGSIDIVAEIGGGYGRLAFVFMTLSANAKLRFVMVDIPPALYLAQWYLAQVFPHLRIFKYRPFSSYAEVAEEMHSASFVFLLPHQLALLPDRSLDLIINISSFQEMSVAQIRRYYELIDAKARYFFTKQWQFWQNPEDKIAVPAIIYPTRPSWTLLAARVDPVHSSLFEAIFEVA